jgi:hypothetical protein
MAYYDQVWYANFGNGSTTGYYAVALRPQNAAVAAGQLVRQFTAPAVGNERVFVCIIAGTTANVTDATWVLTRGAKTTDGTATWMECTGIAAVNGDKTNTVNWTQAKSIGVPTLGTIIQRNNGASYQICTTAGTLGASEPAFSDTAGVTTTETSATTVWTSLGVVGNFTGGQAPHARLANAFGANWFVAGNTVFVGDNHAETQATGNSFSSTLSQTTMSRIICHNHAGNYPPQAADLATTATISTTGGTSITMQFISGSIYIYGLTFIAGTTGNFVSVTIVPPNAFLYFDACVFKIGSTGTNSCYIQLNTGNVSGTVIWNNCKVGFAATVQNIYPGVVNFVWQNTGQVLAAGSSVPAVLIQQNSAGYLTSLMLEALDLSQINTAIFATPAGDYSVGNWVVKDCKLNASVTFPTPVNPGQSIQSIRADSGATAYKSARYVYEGTETTETSVTRVGGASDPTGQAQSRKIVTTANSQWLRPFKAEPYAIWNPTTGANVTVTVFGTINAGALPNNDDIWLEAEYLGSSASPLGTIVTTTKANLFAANAAVPSDTSIWNNAPTTGGDPYWNNVKLLLGFEGVNGSTGAPGMTDESPALSGTGTATASSISTAQFKFGASSCLGAATGAIIYPDSTNFDLGATPFTVEAWVRPSSFSGTTFIVAKFGNNAPFLGWVLYTDTTPHLGFNISTTGTDNNVQMLGGTPIANTWQHVCADFDGTKYRLYLNGVMVGSSTTLRTIFNPAKPLAVGGNSDVNFNFGWNGYLDDVRLTKGVARYASDSGFAVPTAAFPRAGSWLPFKLTTTLSAPQPGMAGYIHVRPRVAKSSMTVYIDPQITLS